MERADLGTRVCPLTALEAVPIRNAKVGEFFGNAERLNDRLSWIAEGNDQMPGERRIVQAVVNGGKVGRLTPMNMEWGNGVQPELLNPSPDAQKLGRIGNETRIIEFSEVAALGVERRAVWGIVSTVAVRIEQDEIDGLERVARRLRIAKEQTEGFQASGVEILGLPQQASTDSRRHFDAVDAKSRGREWHGHR